MNPAVIGHLIYGSFFLNQPKWQYISIPKAACTTVKWWLLEWQHDHRQNNPFFSTETTSDLVIHDLIRADLPQYQVRNANELFQNLVRDDVFRFAFVRNPYSRLFSTWSSKIVLAEQSQMRGLVGLDLCVPTSGEPEEVSKAFESFLEYLNALPETLRWSNPHWIPQTHILLWPRIQLHIFHVETMPSAWQDLQSQLQDNSLPPFRRFNESPLPYSSSFLSDRSRILIRTLYADDFVAFGYDPNVVPPGHIVSNDDLARAFATIPQIRDRNKRIWEVAKSLEQCALNLEHDVKRLEAELQKREHDVKRLEAEVNHLILQLKDVHSSKSAEFNAIV